MIKILIKVICLLVAIAYYTIAERKIMAAIQRRRGPNVVGFWGLLQPLADGLKLIAKELVIPSHANSRIFVIAPLAVLMLSLLSWSVLPFKSVDASDYVNALDLLRAARCPVLEFYEDLCNTFKDMMENPLRWVYILIAIICVLLLLWIGVLEVWRAFIDSCSNCAPKLSTAAQKLFDNFSDFLSVVFSDNPVAFNICRTSAHLVLKTFLYALTIPKGHYVIACVLLTIIITAVYKIIKRHGGRPFTSIIMVGHEAWWVENQQIMNDVLAYVYKYTLFIDPSTSDVADTRYGILVILAISGLSVYWISLAGWASNSKYAFLGSLRSAAQMIAYEVAVSLTILPVVAMAGSANLTEIVLAQESTIWFVFPLLPMAGLFFISMVAETNRTPFDLPEAEAELVAGYNVEYSSITFAMFFLAEYGNMILASLLFVILFLGGWVYGSLTLKGLVFCFLFVLIRATLPRYRYDQLMSIGWKVFLPLATAYFVLVEGLLYAFNAAPCLSLTKPTTKLTHPTQLWSTLGSHCISWGYLECFIIIRIISLPWCLLSSCILEPSPRSYYLADLRISQLALCTASLFLFLPLVSPPSDLVFWSFCIDLDVRSSSRLMKHYADYDNSV